MTAAAATLTRPPEGFLEALCVVDHDDLPALTAAVPGSRSGARITYWSCPSCPYYFTAITAAQTKKVPCSSRRS